MEQPAGNSPQFQQQPYYQEPTHNLNTFYVLFIIKGVLAFFGSIFFLLYAGMGSVFNTMPEFQDNPDMPFNFGSFILIFGLIGFVICIVAGILNIITARYIKQQRNYTFILVMSIISCLSGILGILLGVFTIIEINKPHVKALFDKNSNQ